VVKFFFTPRSLYFLNLCTGPWENSHSLPPLAYLCSSAPQLAAVSDRYLLLHVTPRAAPALALIRSSPPLPPWPYPLPALFTCPPFLPRSAQAKPSRLHCRSGHLGPPCLDSSRRRLCRLHHVLRRPCPLPTSRAPPSAFTACHSLPSPYCAPPPL
jgi:hypothetical protein